MIKYLFLILISFTQIAYAQLKPFIFTSSSVLSINDTTTNIYVVTSLADDDGDGLTYLTAKKYLPSAVSLADAPTDTIFVYGNLPDSTYTIATNCTITAYDLSDKPTLDGSTVVTGWNQFNTSSTDYDTLSQNLADTNTVSGIASLCAGYEIIVITKAEHIYENRIFVMIIISKVCSKRCGTFHSI